MKQPTPELKANPLYAQAMERIRSWLSEKQVGERIDSESEYVRRLGVSLVTVRRALAELEREGVIEKRRGSRSVISDRGQAIKRVAVLYDRDIMSGSLSYGHLLRIQKSRLLLEQAGCPASLYLGDAYSSSTPPDNVTCQQFHRDLQNGLLSGVFSGWAYPNEKWVGALRAANIPLVGLGPLYENMVTYDFEAYIRRALVELKKRGRRRVAYIGSFSQWNVGVDDQKRAELIMKLIHEAGMQCSERWIRQDWHHSVTAAGWSNAREIWTSEKVHPDALILNSSSLWTDVRKSLDSMKVDYSHDLSVVMASEYSPTALPTEDSVIRFLFDGEKMVQKAVQMLVNLMNGSEVKQRRQYVDAWELCLPERDRIRGKSHSDFFTNDQSLEFAL